MSENVTKDNIIELGKDVVKLLDPTGVTSWGDAYRAVKHINKDYETWINAGVEVLGAMPIVGKIGKLGKLSKVIRGTENIIKSAKGTKPVINGLKIPGKLLVKGASKVRRKDLSNSFNTARNTIKLLKVGSSADDVVLGGDIKKSFAREIGHNSGGVASILTPILAFSPISAKYNGWIKSNDSLYNAQNDMPDIINLMIYGNSKGFTPYNKEISLNGSPLQNAYFAKLYPKNFIIADKKLKNTMQQANSENYQNTNISEPIVDSHKFRLSFKDDLVRASDEFDFNPYTISGKLMKAATKPTWKYPKAGFPTFVQEIPVKYSDKSDATLNIALTKK